MSISQQLQQAVVKACKEIFKHELSADDIHFQPTRKDFEGSFTLVTFGMSKALRTRPDAIAEQLGVYLKENEPIVEDFNVVKGFLNIVIADFQWIEQFNHLSSIADRGGIPKNGKKVMVEYSSPNTNKPLHLGHLRNNFLGYSIAEILEAAGYEVLKVNLVNDRGIHICKSMLAYQKFGNGETPQSSGIKGDHLIGKYYVRFDQEYKKEVASLIEQGLEKEFAEKQASMMLEAQEMLKKWEAGEPETVNLWSTMNGWVYEGFDETYKKMGVTFDKYYYESDTYLLGKDIVDEGLEKQVFYKKADGSVWVDLKDKNLDEKLLLRGDGTSVYITQDIGTAELKYQDFAFDKSVYVVGNEQDYHFAVLFAICEKLQKSYASGMYHLSYGMVDLPSGRMKSREGTVVDADDLIQEMINTAKAKTDELGKTDGFSQEQAAELHYTLAMGALKYFLLRVDPKKRMLFNPEESIEFQGNTGPFIQYTHSRISSILRKAEQLSLDYQADSSTHMKLNKEEVELIQLISKFSQVILEAANDFSPAVIAQYAFDLAKEYNRFYAEHPIFNEKDDETRIFRIKLSAEVARTIKSSMRLLGIIVPDRM
ncbi:MAG: arginine--tRNA ligase [Cyclobacteriaceae bacterium]|nr:arginine--tRNA ligase [Cyclobacteriaceae bacterium]MCH8516103.1 arginine--tRNA ligase [Cyclobacteriaceae bacterium]